MQVQRKKANGQVQSKYQDMYKSKLYIEHTERISMHKEY
jgi:hypothetical protein